MPSLASSLGGVSLKTKGREILSEGQIRQRVRELGRQISKDYEGREVVLIGVLKGAFLFMADLVRELRIPVRCDFIRVSSYNAKGKRNSSIRLDFDVTQPIENEHVILVEDILDTGNTLRYLLKHLSAKNPKSLNVCCLLDKKHHPDLTSQVRYVGFDVPNVYLVGYGLDLNGRYRELPYVTEMDLAH